MKLKTLFEDDNAVSPVIGVILMVAITVILAAVIGTFVLNLGQGINQTAPQASFDFDYEDSGQTNVTITHQSGDSIDGSLLNVTVSDDDWNTGDSDQFGSGTISAGSSAKYVHNKASWSGQTVRVVWESENGESSATLSQSTAPN